MVRCDCCSAPIYDFQVLRACCAEHAGQEEGKRALREISKLTNFIMAEVKGEPARSESAVDCAIRIIREANEVAAFIEDNIDPDEGLELRPEIIEKLQRRQKK